MMPKSAPHIDLDLRREFAAMCPVDNHMLSLEEIRIQNNENPFKVWREYSGHTKDDIADAMKMSILDYILLEEGEIDADADEIVNFCYLIGIHPHQLADDSPYEAAMIDALLMVHDTPALLSSKSRMPIDMAEQILMGEVYAGYDELQKQRKNLDTYKEFHALTIAFIDYLFENDGKLLFDEENIFDYARAFLDDADAELEKVNEQIDFYSDEYKEHSKFYNFFGSRLHRGDWMHVAKKIQKTIDDKSFHEASSIYLNNPSFIGRNNFPELTSPIQAKTIAGETKTFSWRAAQRKLMQHIQTRYLAKKEKNKLKEEESRINYNLKFFKEWILSSHDLLAKVENRQIILQHPAFQKFAKRPQPKPNGLWALAQLRPIV